MLKFFMVAVSLFYPISPTDLKPKAVAATTRSPSLIKLGVRMRTFAISILIFILPLLASSNDNWDAEFRAQSLKFRKCIQGINYTDIADNETFYRESFRIPSDKDFKPLNDFLSIELAQHILEVNEVTGPGEKSPVLSKKIYTPIRASEINLETQKLTPLPNESVYTYISDNLKRKLGLLQKADMLSSENRKLVIDSIEWGLVSCGNISPQLDKALNELWTTFKNSTGRKY